MIPFSSSGSDSHDSGSSDEWHQSIRPHDIRHWPDGQPLLALTAYDYSMARLLDEAGVEMILVGDSLGVVMLGHENTTQVTMEDMLRATEAVARGCRRACIVADLPIASYDTPQAALLHAKKLIQAGAHAVKMEGGRDILPQVEALRAEGIEVCGHLGMLPQRILTEGGYRKKGKTEAEAEELFADARTLEATNVFTIVLELVAAPVAEKITEAIQIPTIGIGSGMKTTGQIQVIHDVLGMHPWFIPSHAQRKLDFPAHLSRAITELRAWMGNS